MSTLIRRFLREESGSAVVGEWVFVATILVLGAVAGAAALHTPPLPTGTDAVPSVTVPATSAALPADRR